MMASHCTSPALNSIENIEVITKPRPVFRSPLNMVCPELHAQTVMAHSSKDARWRFTLQTLHQISTLPLETDRKLVQIVQGQPKRHPVTYSLVVCNAKLIA